MKANSLLVQSSSQKSLDIDVPIETPEQRLTNMLSRDLMEALQLEIALHNSIKQVTSNRNEECPCGSGKKYKACHGA